MGMNYQCVNTPEIYAINDGYVLEIYPGFEGFIDCVKGIMVESTMSDCRLSDEEIRRTISYLLQRDPSILYGMQVWEGQDSIYRMANSAEVRSLVEFAKMRVGDWAFKD